jgi:signal transduction histidine kinase
MAKVRRPACRLFVAVSLALCLARLAASDGRTVLVLYSDPSLLPATAMFTDGLHQGIQSSNVQLEAQYLDISRFAEEADERAFAEWLASRYQQRSMPIVVTVGVPASVFATRFAVTIWPQARIVHAAIDRAQLEVVKQRGDAFSPRILDYRRTVEAALTLLPDVRQVSLVAGASEQDRRWLNEAEAALAPLQHRINISRLAGIRLQEVLDRVANLPEDAIAVPVSFFADADDRTFVNADAVLDIAHAANRPVFVNSLVWLGSGAVGGYVMDPDGIGRHTAGLVLNMLDGAVPEAGPSGSSLASRWVFDAVQLQRWNIPERSLPPGSAVVNRQPSLWNQYRWYLLGALSLMLVQTLLIGGLLVQRARRRRAEQSVRTSEAALRMSYERIRQLAGRLIGAQETARARIARDLHDDVCQELASVSLAVGNLRARIDTHDSHTEQTLSALQHRTRDLVDGVRRLSHDLHPATLRHVGLAAALEAHCIEIEQRYDMQVSFDADTDLRELPGDTAVALYRIGQEALRNAATHGDARRVSVSIGRTDGSIEFVVEDDGKGFDREGTNWRGDGLGLVSMEERARLVGGDLVVVTAPGQGTTVRARVPAGAAAAAPPHVDARILTSTP